MYPYYSLALRYHVLRIFCNFEERSRMWSRFGFRVKIFHGCDAILRQCMQIYFFGSVNFDVWRVDLSLGMKNEKTQQ